MEAQKGLDTREAPTKCEVQLFVQRKKKDKKVNNTWGTVTQKKEVHCNGGGRYTPTHASPLQEITILPIYCKRFSLHLKCLFQ